MAGLGPAALFETGRPRSTEPSCLEPGTIESGPPDGGAGRAGNSCNYHQRRDKSGAPRLAFETWNSAPPRLYAARTTLRPSPADAAAEQDDVSDGAGAGEDHGEAVDAAGKATNRVPHVSRLRRGTPRHAATVCGANYFAVFACGRSSGNRMTSRMERAPVRIMVRRSMPMPSPAVGGNP